MTARYAAVRQRAAPYSKTRFNTTQYGRCCNGMQIMKKWGKSEGCLDNRQAALTIGTWNVALTIVTLPSVLRKIQAYLPLGHIPRDTCCYIRFPCIPLVFARMNTLASKHLHEARLIVLFIHGANRKLQKVTVEQNFHFSLHYGCLMREMVRFHILLESILVRSRCVTCHLS